jgi:para-nitrobenzyl esterase
LTIARTAYGSLRGTEIADGVIAWRGIPYARPPAGDLRLRPPRPPEPWQGTRNAAEYGNRSLQPELRPVPDAPPASEDCLYLNVTAPAGAASRPVLFWVHGGGYELGHGPDQAGDGAAFATTHGLVVVTFNYRLGALGFLDVEGADPTGALGLQDQVAALRWTYENIAGFGGDPEQITVYGLSAGGKSVTNLLASPLTKGMIRRAAQSSGGDHVKTQAQARALAGRFFRELGTTPDKIRTVPAGDILHAQLAIATPPYSTWIWRPSVDGTALTSHPLAAVSGGAAAGIPLLAQTCARECALYQLMAPDAAEQADRVLAEYFGAQARDTLLAAYATANPDLDDTALRVAIMTDERYIVRVDRLAGAQSAHAPVWRSRYDGPYTGLADDPEFAPFEKQLQGGHGGDGTGIWQGGEGLSGQLHDAWGAFATTGDPGWTRYTPQHTSEHTRYTLSSRQAMIFTTPAPRLADDPFRTVREAWAGLDWQPGAWWRYDGVS